jgi:hypothetical protein
VISTAVYESSAYSDLIMIPKFISLALKYAIQHLVFILKSFTRKGNSTFIVPLVNTHKNEFPRIPVHRSLTKSGLKIQFVPKETIQDECEYTGSSVMWKCRGIQQDANGAKSISSIWQSSLKNRSTFAGILACISYLTC